MGEPLPAFVRPMLATPGELPARDEGWAYEVKWDGVRAVVFVEDGRVRLMSRRGNDVTASYPELQALAGELPGRPAVLDGEIVALDEDGRPDFGLLQGRIHLTERAQVARMVLRTPVTLMLFDVLHLDGGVAMPLPWSDRRALLESLALEGGHWRTPPSFAGDGRAVAAGAAAQGLEGVVAKLVASPYRPGRRSESWRKVKIVATQDVVIGGYTVGDGARGASFGALLMGLPGEDGRLSYVGKVGGGFSEEALREMVARLAPLRARANPFDESLRPAETAGVVFVESRLVAEVRYQQWTRDGRLRAPTWRGLRPDVGPDEVVRGG